MGGQEEGYFRTLRVPDQNLEGQGHPCCFTPRKIPESFVLISLLKVFQEWGSRRGYLEDIKGF